MKRVRTSETPEAIIQKYLELVRREERYRKQLETQWSRYETEIALVNHKRDAQPGFDWAKAMRVYRLKHEARVADLRNLEGHDQTLRYDLVKSYVQAYGDRPVRHRGVVYIPSVRADKTAIFRKAPSQPKKERVRAGRAKWTLERLKEYCEVTLDTTRPSSMRHGKARIILDLIEKASATADSELNSLHGAHSNGGSRSSVSDAGQESRSQRRTHAKPRKPHKAPRVSNARGVSASAKH